MNSFISWIGGKNYLKKVIVERMPDDFDRYVEVFGGAAWVLFYREKHANLEIYNDYNCDLTNLFRCVKYHGQELQRELMWILNSREVFEDYRAQLQNRGLTDIQRAARFFLILRLSYGSNGRTYGCVKKDVLNMYENLSRAQARLSSVIIENKDFGDILKIYDRPGALFYLDPPYYGTEKYYQVEFSNEDHLRLAESLKALKGKFILSYNESDFIRDLYKDYTIEDVSRQHNLLARYKDGEMKYQELLIRNY